MTLKVPPAFTDKTYREKEKGRRRRRKGKL